MVTEVKKVAPCRRTLLEGWGEKIREFTKQKTVFLNKEKIIVDILLLMAKILSCTCQISEHEPKYDLTAATLQF